MPKSQCDYAIHGHEAHRPDRISLTRADSIIEAPIERVDDMNEDDISIILVESMATCWPDDAYDEVWPIHFGHDDGCEHG